MSRLFRQGFEPGLVDSYLNVATSAPRRQDIVVLSADQGYKE